MSKDYPLIVTVAKEDYVSKKDYDKLLFEFNELEECADHYFDEVKRLCNAYEDLKAEYLELRARMEGLEK